MTITLSVVRGRPLGQVLEFTPGDYLFGRGAECEIRPLSDWVSRQHCLLRVTPTGALIRDLGSRNGTLVNGTLTRNERPLHHGDLLQIGPLVFEVHDPGHAPGPDNTAIDLDAFPPPRADSSTQRMEPLDPI